MRKIAKKAMIALSLYLPSCNAIDHAIMYPKDTRGMKDCVFHSYGKLPKCEKYRFLPADKPKASIEKPVMIEDYQQYRGKIISEAML